MTGKCFSSYQSTYGKLRCETVGENTQLSNEAQNSASVQSSWAGNCSRM